MRHYDCQSRARGEARMIDDELCTILARGIVDEYNNRVLSLDSVIQFDALRVRRRTRTRNFRLVILVEDNKEFVRDCE